MTRHRLFIGIPILLMLGFALVFFLRAESPTVLLEPMYLSPEARTEAVRLRLHPLTSEKKRKAAEKKRVETWDDWVDFRTEILLGDWVKDDAGVDTPEEVEAIRARIRGSAMETAELFKAEGIPPPATPEWPSPEAWEQLKADDPVVVHPTPYEGPQTTDAIMAAYDAGYVELFPNTLDYDSHYSRKEWLQRFLDKGVVIENATDYDFYLKSRFYLIEVGTDMERWKNGAHGVGPIPLKRMKTDLLRERFGSDKSTNKSGRRIQESQLGFSSQLTTRISICRCRVAPPMSAEKTTRVQYTHGGRC